MKDEPALAGSSCHSRLKSTYFLSVEIPSN